MNIAPLFSTDGPLQGRSTLQRSRHTRFTDGLSETAKKAIPQFSSKRRTVDQRDVSLARERTRRERRKSGAAGATRLYVRTD
jgi:hypothetical protein